MKNIGNGINLYGMGESLEFYYLKVVCLMKVFLLRRLEVGS